MTRTSLWNHLVQGLALLATGCVATLPAAPDVNFAAHTTDEGVVIDRMGNGQSAVLRPGGSSLLADEPTFVLRSDSKVLASLWRTNGDIIVRPTADGSGAPTGRVDAGWDQQAIFLTLQPAGDAAFHTGIFKRISGTEVPDALGQPADTILNVSGTYHADIVDAEGKPAGWLRVRVSSFRVPAHIYDGILPDALNGPLGVAAVARLDAAIHSVELQALNPFIGN
jgi:hypothetical protein